MSEHLLDVQNLRVSFDTYAGEVQAVRGVSFYIDKGETLAIVGESGCGKSVSIQTVMGLLPMPPARIKEGHIYYEGKDLTTLTDKQMENYRGKEFSMIFQDSMTSLNPTMRVGRQMVEAILVHQKISREEAREHAISLLGKVGLPEPEKVFKRYPHTMSGGQRQRVGIAQAFLGDPKLLIFDEPTVGLDPEERIHFRNLFSQAAQERLVLLSTHIIEDVQSVCDQLIVIHHGSILFTGAPSDLIRLAAGHVGTFFEQDTSHEQGLHITSRVNTAFGVRCRGVWETLPSYAHAEEPTLEDAYLYLISKEELR